MHTSVCLATVIDHLLFCADSKSYVTAARRLDTGVAKSFPIAFAIDNDGTEEDFVEALEVTYRCAGQWAICECKKRAAAT